MCHAGCICGPPCPDPPVLFPLLQGLPCNTGPAAQGVKPELFMDEGGAVLSDGLPPVMIGAPVAAVGVAEKVRTLGMLSVQGQAKPSQAKPSQAKPSQAKPSLAKPSLARPSLAKPSQAKPSQAKPGQAKPGQAKPSQAKPSQARPSPDKTNVHPAARLSRPAAVTGQTTEWPRCPV